MNEPRFDPSAVPSPAYVCDLGLLEDNLRLLAAVQEDAGCKILLALKGFAMWSTFPLLRRYLAGVAASGLYEAKLGRELFDAEVHVYSPAFRPGEVEELAGIVDHIVFNSVGQWERYRSVIEARGRSVRCGLRVNPEYSEAPVAIYDPCAPGSRFGVTAAQLGGVDLDGISGLHFHTLCQQGAEPLARTLDALERDFAPWLEQVDWLNLGGGHYITAADYDRAHLARLVAGLRERWHVDVYLEPGEAVAHNAGFLVASVLDVVDATVPVAILDTSASAHMPDVLEMPYRPQVADAGVPGELGHDYVLGGVTCMAGDVIGTYSFRRPLGVGDRIVLLDMAPYTMVKNTTFNGVPLPAIVSYDPATDSLETVRGGNYTDYHSRLS